jgi:hypothetical protein
MMDTGEFTVSPVNGRRRKLLFDPDAVEAWVKSRQTLTFDTAIVTGTVAQRRQEKNRKRRLEAARATLDKHRK